MSSADFDRLYPQYRRVIQAIARKYAKRDNDLLADLEQEGAFCLVRLDLNKIKSNPDSFIRMAIRNSMIDYLRKNMPGRYDSLDDRLAAGYHMEQDGTGEVFLTRPNDRSKVDLYDDAEDLPEDFSENL